MHPDLFGNRSQQEQAYSAAVSADVNVAYQCLRNPVSRSQYLLQLHGHDAIGETVGTNASDPMLLMKVMEARELLEDSGTTPSAVHMQLNEIAGDIARVLQALSASFLAADFLHASRLTVELQYLSKLQHETREWLAEKTGTTEARNMT